MPAVYFFLIDVSMNAIQTGATAAACNAIQQVLSDLPVSFQHSIVAVYLMQNSQQYPPCSQYIHGPIDYYVNGIVSLVKLMGIFSNSLIF